MEKSLSEGKCGQTLEFESQQMNAAVSDFCSYLFLLEDILLFELPCLKLICANVLVPSMLEKSVLPYLIFWPAWLCGRDNFYVERTFCKAHVET